MNVFAAEKSTGRDDKITITNDKGLSEDEIEELINLYLNPSGRHWRSPWTLPIYYNRVLKEFEDKAKKEDPKKPYLVTSPPAQDFKDRCAYLWRLDHVKALQTPHRR